MARLATWGFEKEIEYLAIGNYDTTIVRSGSSSGKFVGNVVVTYNPAAWSAVASGADCFARVYLYVPTGGLPSAQQEIFQLLNTVGAVELRLETNGTLTLWAFLGGTTWTQEGSASAAITLDAWNKIELRERNGVGSVDQCEGRLNDVSFASATGLNISDAGAIQVAPGNLTGTGGAGASWYFDDLAVNDSSGASQTSWPPDSKIVLLLPISDSAVGTGWTLGTGTAISANGFDSVNNIPQTGVADLAAGSDPKQIRNATSNANTNYDANLTTYFNAGVGPKSSINVLVPIVATAAPVSTSAKQGTVGIVSNPTIANIALGAGGTAGAFWSGSAGGTFSSGWKISFGTTTYAPSVTITTSPAMRITQVTSSTRIAVVCFMGMYVDFTPGALGKLASVNQSVGRSASY